MNTSTPAPSAQAMAIRPGIGLLAKLGSIIVHADEMLSPDGHEFDADALKVLLYDEEVQQWITDMGPLLPRKRTADDRVVTTAT